jgi:hypothetical protein
VSECYRCQTITSGSGDPVGVCDMCSSFACSPCGARIPGLSLFRCAICWPSVLLISSGVGPQSGGGPSGGSGTPVDPAGPSGGGGGVSVRVVSSTEQFEELVPSLANESKTFRDDWRKEMGDIVASLERLHDGGRYALDQLVEKRKADTQEAPNIPMLNSLDAGPILGKQVSDAKSREELDRDLFADALGVASWAINVPVGAQPAPDRLALLSDTRITFVVGFLSPAFA